MDQHSNSTLSTLIKPPTRLRRRGRRANPALGVRAMAGAKAWLKFRANSGSRAKTAALVHVSRGSLDAGIVVLRGGDPALINAVDTGQGSLFAAARLARMRTRLRQRFPVDAGAAVTDGGIEVTESV